MRQKKTISVEFIKDIINYKNHMSTCAPEVRRGWNSILQDILMQTGNYRGFYYLRSGEVPDSEVAGILTNAQGDICYREDGMPFFPDETRINFF